MAQNIYANWWHLVVVFGGIRYLDILLVDLGAEVRVGLGCIG